MFRTLLLRFFLLASLLLLVACQPVQQTPTPGTQLPNPASVYCEQHGGKLQFRTDASGGVAGVCVFPDGSQCDEWAYFRGECKPSDNPSSAPTIAPAARPVPTAAGSTGDDWKLYQNNALGYRFRYPADAVIGEADDPLRTLTITGPLSGDDHWPVIYISHPTDREEYRPPQGVALEKWLIDHYLLMPPTAKPSSESRLADLQIAGTTAIHTRYARSPQTYAFDKFYFAHAQQLYVLTILHTADKEDWQLYNHFLDSFQFTA